MLSFCGKAAATGFLQVPSVTHHFLPFLPPALPPFLCFGKLPSNPDWPQTHHVAEGEPGLSDPLTASRQQLGYRCLICMVLDTEHRTPDI